MLAFFGVVFLGAAAINFSAEGKPGAFNVVCALIGVALIIQWAVLKVKGRR